MTQKTNASIRIAKISCLIALVLFLSSCSENDVLIKEKKDIVISCLNDHDLDGLQNLFYPDRFSNEELEANLQEIADIWHPVDADDARLIRFNSRIQIYNDQRFNLCEGVYRLPGDMAQYALYISFEEINDTKGITDIHMIPLSDSPISLIIRIACFCFIAFSIVDVVIKKPRKYGCYILLCLMNIPYNINEATFAAIPVGAAIYWFLRKNLMKEKASMKTGG